MNIEENDLLKLIFWARRYCDRRSTYAPSEFNKLYDFIVQLNPKIREQDQFDHTLLDKGKYWPYAQDDMFDEKTGVFDARNKLNNIYYTKDKI